MKTTELLDLLREARECVICPFAYRQTMYCACTFCALKNRIDAALAERQEEWDIETARNHHAGCAVYDDGGCTCGFRARRETLERSPLAVGEGTWSVFAQKVVKERDEARAEVERLQAALAGRAEGSTEDVVEWESGDNYEWTGRRWCATTIGDRVINIHALNKAATRFYWRVFSTLDEEGHQPTLAEAKSAAIAAARGVR
jgi:hypothetical protein